MFGFCALPVQIHIEIGQGLLTVPYDPRRLKSINTMPRSSHYLYLFSWEWMAVQNCWFSSLRDPMMAIMAAFFVLPWGLWLFWWSWRHQMKLPTWFNRTLIWNAISVIVRGWWHRGIFLFPFSRAW